MAGSDGGLTRRAFLGGLAAAGTTVAFGAATGRRLATSIPGTTPFPADVPLFRQTFENWAKDIVVDDLPTCAPANEDQLLRVADWAAANGRRLRARGAMHTWSPLVVADAREHAQLVLVDTSGFASIDVRRDAHGGVVTAGSGATLEAVLDALERFGLGITACPAPGDVTMGGILAIDGHGTGVPARGERPRRGVAYGSVSNLVEELSVVVWDRPRGRFRVRTFDRTDPAIGPWLASLGRGFVTRVTLRAAPNERLRCVSTTDVPWTELFAAPGAATTRSFQRSLDAAGRVEAIWFPFTDRPWLKVWSVTPRQPATSRLVSGPYNYSFAQLDDAASARLKAATISDPSSVGALGRLSLDTVTSGLAATSSADLWGWSKNLMLYVRPQTLRYSANGYAVITSRRRVQTIVHDFTRKYDEVVRREAARGRYPANGPVEIRVSGLDRGLGPTVPGGAAPWLSALRPRRDRPDWDVAIWFDILTFRGTPGADDLYRELERWLIGRQEAWSALVRPEWSKGWGYGAAGPWTDRTFVTRTVPDSFRRGYGHEDDWDAAAAAFRAADPHGVFHNPLTSRLLPG